MDETGLAFGGGSWELKWNEIEWNGMEWNGNQTCPNNTQHLYLGSLAIPGRSYQPPDPGSTGLLGSTMLCEACACKRLRDKRLVMFGCTWLHKANNKTKQRASKKQPNQPHGPRGTREKISKENRPCVNPAAQYHIAKSVGKLILHPFTPLRHVNPSF